MNFFLQIVYRLKLVAYGGVMSPVSRDLVSKLGGCLARQRRKFFNAFFETFAGGTYIKVLSAETCSCMRTLDLAAISET